MSEPDNERSDLWTELLEIWAQGRSIGESPLEDALVDIDAGHDGRPSTLPEPNAVAAQGSCSPPAGVVVCSNAMEGAGQTHQTS
jgi:hypothetical protein